MVSTSKQQSDTLIGQSVTHSLGRRPATRPTAGHSADGRLAVKSKDLQLNNTRIYTQMIVCFPTASNKQTWGLCVQQSKASAQQHCNAASIYMPCRFKYRHFHTGFPLYILLTKNPGLCHDPHETFFQYLLEHAKRKKLHLPTIFRV